MRRFMVVVILTCLPVGVASARTLPPAPVLAQSPWDGDWVLSRTRNTDEIMAEAAPGYRFQIGADNNIRWEIPALHEVVQGRLDGQPMPIRRPGPTPLTLAVSAQGPWVLVYRVERNGIPEGEGRMTLVDQGRAWVDLSQPTGRPDLAGAVVYVRPDAANR